MSRILIGTPDPATTRGGAKKDWRLRNKTGGVVQGSDRRTGQKPETAREAVARKARERADAAAKKPTPKDKPGKGKTPMKSTGGKPANDPALAGRHTVAGKTFAQQQEQRRQHLKDTQPHLDKLDKNKKNSQPGPGASTGGSGRDDAAAGKTRSEFEKARQKDRGTGVDRPGVYKPPTDYRGGYQSKASPKAPGTPGLTKGPETPAGRPLPPSKGGTVRTDVKTIPPVPGSRPTPKKKPGIYTGAVKGMTVRI